MKSKLTLSVEPGIIELAHQQAKQKGVSVSSMFSGYVVTQQKQQAKPTNKPQLEDMIGLFKQLDIDDSKIGIRNAYAKKHLS